MTHTLEAIAWTLIHFCWQAAIIAAAYRLVSIPLARFSSDVRYSVALAGLLLMAAVSIVTLASELGSGPLSAGTSSSPTMNWSALATRASVAAAEANITTVQPGTAAITLASALPWIDGLWVFGVLALSIRSLGGWWLIQGLRSSASLEPPADVLESFKQVAAALGVRRPVMLRISSAISGPVTVGALRALVLLPLSAVTSLGPDELEVVLAHELAHVRRADFFWNLIQTLVETLFFFHPAVWWMSARIRYERELCCDDLALTVCPNPVVYASALFRLEQQRSRHWQLTLALDGHQSHQTLRMRIARILGEPMNRINRRTVQPISLAVAAIAALVVLLLPAPQVMASLHKASPAQPAAAAIARSAEPNARATHPSVAAVIPGSSRANAAVLAVVAAEPQDKPSPSHEAKPDYIDKMKAAGYDIDLDQYIAMKVQEITPEYARAMSQLGFGKLSADDLIACKVQGVTPETIAKMKAEGIAVKSIQDAISLRIFEVTPEFISAMKAAGFDNLNTEQLLALRVQGVTPEYAREIAKRFPGATADDLVKTRMFNIDEAFIALAKRHGFNDLTLEKLVKLRISGILDNNESQ